MKPEIIKNAIEYIKEIFAGDSSGHDHFHTYRVYKTAVLLAERENADVMTVSLAALLHDADDVKLSPQTYENKDRAVIFLKENGVDDETIKRICGIIDEISFAGRDSVVPSTIEGKCVQDADRLDALGAIGIARAFAYGGIRGRMMYDPEVNPKTDMSREEYAQSISTTINHFYEKLFLLKDKMNTETGRKLADQRESYMREYIEEFMDEWNGVK